MSELYKDIATSMGATKDYADAYLRNVREIISIANDPAFLRSHIRSKQFDDAESLLRFSLVFNDLTLLSLHPGDSPLIVMLKSKWFEDRFGTPEVTIEASYEKLKSLGVDLATHGINPGFIFPGGSEPTRLFDKLRPLVESGRMIIQPDRAIFQPSPNEKGGHDWSSIDVSQFSSLDSWKLSDENSSPSNPILVDPLPSDHERKLFEISIPYLRGVGFSDFSEILLDEQDLLSSLRASLMTAIKAAKAEDDAATIVKEIVSPKVDMIGRKFKSLVSTHSFKVAGAAVSTVVLAYTATATAGLAGALATVAGAGGFGVLANEYSSFKKEYNTIKDDPFYFFWRCKKN